MYEFQDEEADVLFECSVAAVDVSSNDVGWLTADADLLR